MSEHRRTDARRLDAIIDARGATASRILQRARWLAETGEALRRQLQRESHAPWADGLRLANVREDCAVLYADNSSAASLARLAAPRILEALRSRRVRCRQVVVKVRPLPDGSGIGRG